MGRWIFVALLLVGCGDDDGFVDAGDFDGGAVDGGADGGVDGGGGDVDGGTDAAMDASIDGAFDAGFDAMDAGPSRLDEVLRLLEADASNEGELDTLLHDVGWAEGWPLRDGDRYLFLTRWEDPGGPVSWVGAFNEWTAGDDPATVLATGVHHWALITTTDDPAGAGYKWHAAAPTEVWRAPPEATRYEYDAFGELGLVAAPRGRSWFERFPDLVTEAMPLPRHVRVRMPADWAPGARRVLLLHDGQNVFGPDAIFGGWRVDQALDEGFPDVLAVAVDNAADRFDAYTHVPDMIRGMGPLGGSAGDYLALLEDEVLPFVRARYGVEARGDSLMVSGSSLGGLVSLFIAQERPALAGCAAGLSSTLGWGAFQASGPGSADTLFDRWTEHGPVAIYLDSGGNVTGSCGDFDADGVHEDGDDLDNYCTTLQLRDHLESLGYEFDTDLFHWWEPGAPHNEAAWRARFPRALTACQTAGWVAL